MAKYILCPGVLSQDLSGHIICDTSITVQSTTSMNAKVDASIATYLSVNGYNPAISFDVTMIDATIATGLFTAGFILSIVPWATAWGAAQLLRLLR